jgi:hypothetical protein
VAVDEGSGRVRGVIYLKGGEEYFQPSDVVLLAGYTYRLTRRRPAGSSWQPSHTRLARAYARAFLTKCDNSWG